MRESLPRAAVDAAQRVKGPAEAVELRGAVRQHFPLGANRPVPIDRVAQIHRHVSIGGRPRPVEHSLQPGIRWIVVERDIGRRLGRGLRRQGVMDRVQAAPGVIPVGLDVAARILRRGQPARRVILQMLHLDLFGLSPAQPFVGHPPQHVMLPVRLAARRVHQRVHRPAAVAGHIGKRLARGQQDIGQFPVVIMRIGRYALGHAGVKLMPLAHVEPVPKHPRSAPIRSGRRCYPIQRLERCSADGVIVQRHDIVVVIGDRMHAGVVVIKEHCCRRQRRAQRGGLRRASPESRGGRSFLVSKGGLLAERVGHRKRLAAKIVSKVGLGAIRPGDRPRMALVVVVLKHREHVRLSARDVAHLPEIVPIGQVVVERLPPLRIGGRLSAALGRIGGLRGLHGSIRQHLHHRGRPGARAAVPDVRLPRVGEPLAVDQRRLHAHRHGHRCPGEILRPADDARIRQAGSRGQRLFAPVKRVLQVQAGGVEAVGYRLVRRQVRRVSDSGPLDALTVPQRVGGDDVGAVGLPRGG